MQIKLSQRTSRQLQNAYHDTYEGLSVPYGVFQKSRIMAGLLDLHGPTTKDYGAAPSLYDGYGQCDIVKIRKRFYAIHGGRRSGDFLIVLITKAEAAKLLYRNLPKWARKEMKAEYVKSSFEAHGQKRKEARK